MFDPKKVLQNLSKQAKTTLNVAAVYTAAWMRRLALAAVLLIGVITATAWSTFDQLIPHVHNVYSAAKLVYGEARGESPRGQKGVYATLDVRVQHNQFPDTKHEVMFQPYSTTDEILQYNAMGDTLHEDMSTELGQQILRRVAWWYLQEQLGIFQAPKEAQGAHSYCRPDACASQSAYFGKLKIVGQIGDHVFYKDCNDEEVVMAESNENNSVSPLRPRLRPESLVLPEQDDQEIYSSIDDLVAQLIAEEEGK